MRIFGFGRKHGGQERANEKVVDGLQATRRDFAWGIGKMLHERKPPFNRQEWHDPNVLIPEEWDAFFEMAAWSNSFVVLTNQIKIRLGDREGDLIAAALIDYFNSILSDRSRMSDFAAMLLAEPVGNDHAVFSFPETKGLVPHANAFGRAKVIVNRIALPEGQRLAALSKLGRCLVFNTHHATLRFGAIAEQLRILETPDAQQENLAEKLAMVAAEGEKVTTIGQSEKFLIEVENLLLRKILEYEPEASISPVVERAHKAAADATRETLVIEMAKRTGVTPAFMRAMYNKSRELRELQMIMRWAADNSLSDIDTDKIVAEALEDYKHGRKSWKEVSSVWSGAMLSGIPQTEEKYEILLKKVKAGLPHLEETIKNQEKP